MGRIDIVVKSLLLFALFVISSFSPMTTLAFMNNYLPLNREEIGKPFPLKYHGTITDEEIIKSLPAGIVGTTVTRLANNDILLKGLDKNQKKWTVQIEGKSVMYPYFVYTADLDNNEVTDLVFLYPTGGNGLAPQTHLMTIMFDEMGRPIPFTADGYFDYDKKGIRDLVDINHDGNGELIYMNFDDGYWITSLYSANKGRWEKIQGQFRMTTEKCTTVIKEK
jgi:hypothetical protein